MTSEQISEMSAGISTPEINFWLKEIAYQLAVMNRDTKVPALAAQLKQTAGELETVWRGLSYAPNRHVEASRNLLARIENDLTGERQ